MHALDVVCFDESFRFSFRAMREFALHPRATVWLAEISHADGVDQAPLQSLAGFVIVHVKRRQGYLVTLDVAPAWRRQGVARALLDQAQVDLESLTLHVFRGNEGAICFYERNGFEPQSLEAGFYGAGRDALIFRRRVQH